jgi:hypothetical protein
MPANPFKPACTLNSMAHMSYNHVWHAQEESPRRIISNRGFITIASYWTVQVTRKSIKVSYISIPAPHRAVLLPPLSLLAFLVLLPLPPFPFTEAAARFRCLLKRRCVLISSPPEDTKEAAYATASHPFSMGQLG